MTEKPGAPLPPPPQAPQVFGRYQIIEPLAKGGMAQVYRAKSTQGRIFTLKKILKDYSDNPDFVKMFLEEAKLSLSMKHPQVVRVLDFGQIEESYFLAMEYVFGRDLSAVLKKSAELKIFIPIDVVCNIIYQCCLGLHYAHTLQDTFGNPLNIVHRDISPPNVLVSYNGEVKILDFGIAKAVSSSRREETRSGVLKGKFSYMSPEQASGKPLTAQSDVFSLGTVFYELLTSKNLFYRPDELETLEAVKKGVIPPIRKIRGDVTAGLEKIVLKALAAKTKNRYSSAAEMSEDVRLFMHEHYSHSDARMTARFLRKLFSQDFEVRSPVAISEGWQDILDVGGLDEDLLLDVSEPGTETQSLRPLVRPHQLQWHEKLIYDPHMVRRIQTGFLQFILLVGVFLASFMSYDYIRRWQDEPLTTNQVVVAPIDSLTPSASPAAVGTFQYWKSQGENHEAQKNLEAALQSYKRALEISPFDEDLLTRVDFLELATGAITSSCERLMRSTKLATRERLLSEAYCLHAQGFRMRALTAYSQFISRFPEDPLVPALQLALAELKRNQP